MRFCSRIKHARFSRATASRCRRKAADGLAGTPAFLAAGCCDDHVAVAGEYFCRALDGGKQFPRQDTA